jgi:hypothetical protein
MSLHEWITIGILAWIVVSVILAFALGKIMK